MSEEYFYLVNKYNHNVLEIPDSTEGRGLQCIREGDGAETQLWTYNEKGLLVSKTGLVLTIRESSDEKDGGKLVGWPVPSVQRLEEAQLNQEWKGERGLILNISKNLALGLDKKGQARMWDPHDKTGYEKFFIHWHFVPQEYLKEYRCAVKIQNPIEWHRTLQKRGKPGRHTRVMLFKYFCMSEFKKQKNCNSQRHRGDLPKALTHINVVLRSYQSQKVISYKGVMV